MGSSWHANVWEAGLGGIGATVCARLLGAGETWLTNALVAPDTNLAVVATAPPTSGSEVYTWSARDITGLGHFPYGFAVEPNVPV